jgi:hypothetical protein
MFGITRKPKSEHRDEEEGPATTPKHRLEIIRPEVLGQWALEKNRGLELLHEAMHDWGERLRCALLAHTSLLPKGPSPQHGCS